MKKISVMQAWLAVLYVSALMISNVVGAKQIQLPFGITMSGGFAVFPVVYVLSDLFSEVYGYRWSRKTCYMAFVSNLLMVAVFSIVIATPFPEHWSGQASFSEVLGNAPRMVFASLASFVAGDFVNDAIFSKMKKKHPETMDGFGGRAILSSVAGECVDSLVFVPIAFIGKIPAQAMLTMIVAQVVMKTAYEMLIFPVTRFVCKKMRNYEMKEG